MSQCGETYLQIWVAGDAKATTYLWAGLDHEDSQISHSAPLQVSEGTYLGYYLHIPIDGLGLNTDDYTLSIYHTNGLADVGDPAKSTVHTTGIVHLEFDPVVISKVNAKPKQALRKTPKWGSQCMEMGEHIELMADLFYGPLRLVQGRGPEVSAAQWEIIPATAVNNTVYWDLDSLRLVAMEPCICTVAVSCYGMADSMEIHVETCTHPYNCCTRGQMHAGFFKEYPSGDIVGADAEFLVRYGARMCGSANSHAGAFSWVWVSVEDTIGTPGVSIWAQTGFGNYRPWGSKQVYQTRYLEVIPQPGYTPYQFVDYTYFFGQAPPANTWHRVAVQLDPSTGRWTGLLDGANPIPSVPFSVWQTRKGEFAEWCAEILNSEDDMAGTSSDRSEVRDFRIWPQNQGNYVGTTLLGGSLRYSDLSEWMVDVSSGWTDISVWDVNPR